MSELEVDEFLKYLLHQKRGSPLTAEAYKTDLTQFRKFLQAEDGELSPEKITYHHIRHFISLQMEDGNSAETVHRKLSALRSFFKYLQKNGTVTVNPVNKIRGPKKAKKLPVFLDEGQTEDILRNEVYEQDFNGLRDKLLIELFYMTGIRRAELINLKEADIDLFNLQLKVLGKRNKERLIPFSLEFKRNLSHYLNVKQEEKLSSPYLLVTLKNKQLSPHMVTKTVRAILERISLSGKKSPHVLRHTFATHMLDNGADINAVKEILGHSGLAATQIYTHNTIDKLKRTYRQAHPRSGE